RGQVVDLVGLHPLHRGDQTALVEQVAADQADVAEDLAHPAHPRVGLPPDQAPYLVSLGQQMLGQVGAILAGNAGDQSASSQRGLRSFRPAGASADPLVYVAAAYRSGVSGSRCLITYGTQDNARYCLVMFAP